MNIVKKKLFISIPSLWSIRNFIYSDFIKQINPYYEIHFLVPENSDYFTEVKKTGYPVHLYPDRKSGLLEKSIYKSLNRKLISRSVELQRSKLVQLTLSKPHTLHQFISYYFSILLGLLFNEKTLARLYYLIAFDKIYKETRELIAEDSSSIIIATNFVVKHELNLFINLRNLKNTKINFVNSFDNTTSRGFIPYQIFDSHIVWNQKMKHELNEIFNINTSQIHILGTPQFDLLFNSRGIPLPEDDNLYKITETSKYILYCAGHSSLLPFEKEIVEKISNYISAKYPEISLVVRLHPLDEHEKWFTHFISNDRLRFDLPWKQNVFNPLLSVPEKTEYTRHARILNNALLILNIGSTTSLDACVLNKPIYNMFFDEFNNDGALDLIYKSEHFDPIIQSESAPLIKNLNNLGEIIEQLYKYNYETSDLSAKRASFANTYCGFSEENSFTDRFKNLLDKIYNINK